MGFLLNNAKSKIWCLSWLKLGNYFLWRLLDTCVWNRCSEKTVSAVAIYDGMHACFADKFGAVGRWICMDLMETSHWKIQSLNPRRNVHNKISTTRGLGPNSVFKWYMAIAIVDSKPCAI